MRSSICLAMAATAPISVCVNGGISAANLSAQSLSGFRWPTMVVQRNTSSAMVTW
jgi:hypothetical protein